ncbi:MAG: YdcF family protein [Flavisolibacter sp.]
MEQNKKTFITEEVKTLAKKLWDYHHMHHDIEKSDCILVLGSHDTRVADRAAELWLDRWAPIIIFSGGLGRLTKEMWSEPEADLFARIAREKGVPDEAIFTENRSTNTGENIIFTQQLLQSLGLNPQRFIVVQKPYMERRSYATFKKHWPDKTIFVTSPQIDFENYPTVEIPLEKLINIMVGDTQRIPLYAEKGFQIAQSMPQDVWQAYKRLVELGFDEHLTA